MEHPLPPPDSAAPPPRPRRRLRRVLIWVGASVAVAILAVLLIVPPIIASTIRSKFLASVHQNTNATASMGGASFSWTGRVSLRDIELKDKAGATLASVKSVRAKVGLLSALKGPYEAEFEIDSPRIELRRGDDGRLNLASIAKPPTGGEDAPSTPSSAPRQIPDFHATLVITNALIVIEGGKEKTEFPLSGSFAVRSEGNRITLDGKNAIKDGSIDIAGLLDLRDGAQGGSNVDVTIARVPLDARMGPVLELLHPAFSIASGRLEGVMDGTVSLRHEGSLLAAGADPVQKLSGKGRIDIRDCSIGGSHFLGDLLKALGTEKREILLNPVEFRIEDGRIIYDKPWQWTMAGSDTTFTGSIGLDRTLDLMWRVPVTDDLASRVPALKSLRGRTFEAPIGGTVSKPRLDWKGLVGQAAGGAIEDAAKRGLEGLLGGRDEKKAEKLLEEADRLHGEGKKGEAAGKYRKIKDDYDKTRVYKENKDRIHQRAEEK